MRGDSQVDDEFQRAYACALRLLGMCDRSRKDLKERLQKKDYSPEATESVLTHMEYLGYIDDRRFSLKFAAEAVKRKNLGPEAVRAGLYHKGVSREVIEATVERIFKENDEQDIARRALGKKLEIRSKKLEARSKKQEARRDEIKRLSDYLRRRGFSYDIIKRTIGELEKGDDI